MRRMNQETILQSCAQLPVNTSEAEGDLALIQTSLLFHLNARKLVLSQQKQ